MKIPERADKWIVFAATLAVALDDLLRSKGIDLDAKSIIAVPLILAVIGTTIYLIWRALCRLSARLLLRNRSSENVRVFANSVFIAAFLLSVFWPVLFPGHVTTVTFRVPAKVDIHTQDPAGAPKEP